jgi:hypothetical protein
MNINNNINKQKAYTCSCFNSCRKIIAAKDEYHEKHDEETIKIIHDT